MTDNQTMLGKLHKIPLREAWKNEEYNFTTWLAKEENLNLLGEEIGISITLIQTEATIGKFSVDILAEEENTEKKIIIENQLEPPNHDHLGKIITYAAGSDAEIIIWVVSDIRQEYEQAINWLNEHSNKEINYFVVKIELWQINESAYAPKFQVISKPNEWAKSIKSFVDEAELPESKLLKLDYWSKFKEYAENKKTALSLRTPRPQHWYDISLGTAYAHISVTLNSKENIITCHIWISDSKKLFYALKKHKDEIEKEVGSTLEWSELPGRKACWIKLVRSADVEDPKKWNEYFDWMLQHIELFHRVFGKYIKNL